MKMTLKLIIVSFIFSVVLSGCVNTIYPFRIPYKSPKIPENSIKKDIPRYPNNKLFAFYKFTKQKQKQLNLSIPENGFDSLLVRMWFSYPEGLYQLGEMVELRFKSDSLPIVTYTKMRLFFNPSRLYEVINYHKDSIINEPISGWSEFIDKLKKSDITDLPTIENIPKYIELSGDGFDYANTSMTVSVEISQKDTYRFYQYNNFEKYKHLVHVNMLYTFIKYIRKDLSMLSIDPEWYKE
jgi:hypothetical protein